MRILARDDTLGGEDVGLVLSFTSRERTTEASSGNQIILVPSADIAPVDSLCYRDVPELIEAFSRSYEEANEFATHRPTFTLLRLEAALRIWQSGKYDYILVSGGRTHKPDRETRPAADTMAEWLVAKDVPADRIIVESESLDTYENASLGLKALRELGILDPQITVVSQWQHTIRFWLAFRALGVKIKRYGLHYPIGRKGWLMEWVLIFIHIIDPLGTGRVPTKNREQRRRQAMGQ